MSHQKQFFLEYMAIFFTSTKSPVTEHQIKMIVKYRSFTWSMVTFWLVFGGFFPLRKRRRQTKFKKKKRHLKNKFKKYYTG